MRIGLAGLRTFSSNKGCMALTYSFIDILKKIEEISGNEFEITVFAFEEADIEKIRTFFPATTLVVYSLKNPKSICILWTEVAKCDCVFDFTEGDSFSDIYGSFRLFKFCIVKLIASYIHVPLILGPQTYGPYSTKFSRVLARKILKEATLVSTRDKLSSDLVQKIAGVNSFVVCDIAFGLPVDRTVDTMGIQKNEKKKIGINISALLWNGGYNGNNQFNLTVDYKEYCIKIISFFIEEGYEVHLIPHVYSKNDNDLENDYLACIEVKEKFPECRIAPLLDLPTQIKSYISNMDFFIGARMHATIAAFSTGVITIPFSYSPKFEGLYGSVGYNFIIRGKVMTTDEAINKTLLYVHNPQRLVDSQKSAMIQINNSLVMFEKWILDYITGVQ